MSRVDLDDLRKIATVLDDVFAQTRIAEAMRQAADEITRLREALEDIEKLDLSLVKMTIVDARLRARAALHTEAEGGGDE